MSEAFVGPTAEQLRKAFDGSFAKPPATEREDGEELLAIRAHDSQLAVRTRETAGILRCPPLAVLPSGNAALWGLAGVRGTIVGVYSLAALVGEGRSSRSSRSSEMSGWIVLCAADRSMALLFEELIGYERVQPREIHTAEKPALRTADREVVRILGTNRAVISVPSLLESIRRTAQAGTDEE